jgi:hypothetical protein
VLDEELLELDANELDADELEEPPPPPPEPGDAEQAAINTPKAIKIP